MLYFTQLQPNTHLLYLPFSVQLNPTIQTCITTRSSFIYGMGVWKVVPTSWLQAINDAGAYYYACYLSINLGCTFNHLLTHYTFDFQLATFPSPSCAVSSLNEVRPCFSSRGASPNVACKRLMWPCGDERHDRSAGQSWSGKRKMRIRFFGLAFHLVSFVCQ